MGLIKNNNEVVKLDPNKKFRVHLYDGTSEVVSAISKVDAKATVKRQREATGRESRSCLVTEEI